MRKCSADEGKLGWCEGTNGDTVGAGETNKGEEREASEPKDSRDSEIVN